VMFAMPAWDWIRSSARTVQRWVPAALQPATQAVGQGLQLFLVVAALMFSAAWLAGGTYNPFIYFRF
jgi:alginate O-acetyltransferase complex protein AlgI